MTNYTEEESDCLERCLTYHRQPTDTKIFKKLHLGLREIENYRENQISKSYFLLEIYFWSVACDVNGTVYFYYHM